MIGILLTAVALVPDPQELRVSDCAAAKSDHVVAAVSDCWRYECMHPHFAKAFEFLKRKDLSSLAPGRYEIDGDDCFAMVQDVSLTPLVNDSLVEAHREYIDIHAPLTCDETIGVMTMDAERLALPFDEAKDVVLFKARTRPMVIRPGEFAIFVPPYGAHAPGHSHEREGPARKIVIKVKKNVDQSAVKVEEVRK